jgi:cytoskeleton protein RodZ
VESFGEYIRSQRELRQVTQEEVCDVTKVSLKYINALEADKSEYLPSRAYVIGFLRVYSRYLGLDDDAVVTRYMYASAEGPEESSAQEHVEKEVRKKRISRLFKKSLWAVFFAVASLLLIASV